MMNFSVCTRGITLALVLVSALAEARTIVGRYGHAAVSVHETLYMLGGASDTGLIAAVERINPATGEVDTAPGQLFPRMYHTAVAHEGLIYILGGYVQAPGTPIDVEVYSPATGTSRVITQLPASRTRAAAAVIGNQLVVIGGTGTNRNAMSEVDVFDIPTETWRRGAAKPTPVEAAAVVLGGRIVVPGGYDRQAGTTAVEAYDPVADRWETLPPLPVRTSAHAVAEAGGRVYLFGDYNQVDRVLAGDPLTGEWVMLDPGYTPGRHAAAVALNDTVWVTGGSVASRGSHLDRLQRFSRAELEAAPARAVTTDDDRTPQPPTTQSRSVMVQTGPPIPDGVDEVIATMARGMADLTALEITYTLQSNHPLLGPLGEPQPWLTFAYRLPNHYYLAVPGHDILWIHDAQGTRVRSPGRKRFWQAEGPAPRSDQFTLFAMLNITPDLEALIQGDAIQVLHLAARQRSWERGEVSGQDTNGLAVVVNSPRRHLTRHQGPVRMVIDQATGLIQYIEPADVPAGTPSEARSLAPLEELLQPTTIRLTAHVTTHTTANALDWPSVVRAEDDILTETVEEIFNIPRRPGTASSSPAPAQRPEDTLPGQAAPDFSVTLFSGERWRLADQRGKVVVIDFWATWCGPCVRALPAMKQLAETFAGQDVVFIGLSRDRREDADKARQVLAEHGITYANAMDLENLAARYLVRGIPNVLLIDREGIVRSRKVGFSTASAKTLEAEIQQWLATEVTP